VVPFFHLTVNVLVLSAFGFDKNVEVGGIQPSLNLSQQQIFVGKHPSFAHRRLRRGGEDRQDRYACRPSLR